MNGNGSVGVFVHLESFLVGLCCLVGGDQFYIFVSQTDASVKTQCNMAVSISIITLVVVILLDDYVDKSLSNLFHLYYFFLLLATIIFSFYKTRSATIITVYNAFLAHVLTFFIVQVCINYSHYRNLMQTFLLGMLSSRLLPSFAWLTMNKTTLEPQTVLSSLSTRLNIIRVLICLLSLVLKLLNGTFFISFKGPPFIRFYNKYFSSELNFKLLYEVFKKLWMGIFPIISLIFSLVMFVTFSPMMHTPLRGKMYFNYSPHLFSSLSTSEIVFHFLGSCLGVLYPASITTNSYKFDIHSVLIYNLYFIIFTFLSYYGKYFTDMYIHIIVILCSSIIGYLWSYCLMIVYNMFLVKTCKYEEISKPCCGYKINNECYCRLPDIVEHLSKASLIESNNTCSTNSFIDLIGIRIRSLLFSIGFIHKPSLCSSLNMFSCSKSFVVNDNQSGSLEYSTDGTSAILILYKIKNEISLCEKTCSGVCSGGMCSCLKLFGVYKIGGITTSSCNDCQLTVRFELEATCCCNRNSASSGHTRNCVCNCPEKNCCCLPINCCQNGRCQGNPCCCVKLCCCQGCGACTCNDALKSNKARVFICFGGKDESKFVKEIKPDRNPNFNGDITILNQFYITKIFLSDCCHTDLVIDLHCTMKNNFFRLTPISYKNKTVEPFMIALTGDDSECCNGEKKDQCCCKNNPLVRVHVVFESMKEIEYACTCKPTCQSSCNCCFQTNKKNCCCCKGVGFYVSKTDSYSKYIEPIRVKLICIIWLLFLVGLLISMSMVSRTKDNRLRYYKFEFITSFKTIDKELKKNKLNYTPLVFHRLREIGDLTNEEVVKEKVEDLNTMIGLCKCAFDKDSLNALKKTIFMKSNKLVSSPQFLNKKIGLELLKWSYCCGIVFTYVIQTFLRIQSFFVRWEYVWEREYFNYRKLMTSNFTSTTHISKFAVSLMSEIYIPEKNQYYIDRTRKNSWKDAHDELDRFVNLFDKEQQNEYEPPPNIDERLGYYLNRWKHRVESIRYWTLSKTNVFEWKYFISDYKRLKIWHDSFVPYLQRAAINIDIPKKKLNEEMEIFTGRKKK